MKKIFSFVAAALMSASMFATPATVPTVTDLAGAGYDVTNRVICLYFDEQVCNDIVWAGTYVMNEKGDGWETNPEVLSKFEPLEGFEGWYAFELEDTSDPCQGKPVQLKKDGSFAWDFQAGDVDAWFNMDQPGTQTATIEAGFSGEANCTWPTTGAYIYEVAYFKMHNSPCGEDKPKHDYTITAYLPEFCDAIAAYADSARVMGGFDGWTDGIWMEKKIDEDFNDCWYAEIKDVEEGTEFKLRFGTDGDWAVQVQLNGQNLGNMMTGETTDIVLQFDGVGYGFGACAAALDYDIYLKAPEMCRDNIVPAIVGDATPGGWDAGTAMTWDDGENAWYIKLEQAKGSFKFYDLNMGWSNEIQMWDGEKWEGTPNLTLGEETVVYVEYNTEAYRWKDCGVSDLAEIKAAKIDGKFFENGQLFIKANNKVYNVLGAAL